MNRIETFALAAMQGLAGASEPVSPKILTKIAWKIADEMEKEAVNREAQEKEDAKLRPYRNQVKV
jgi:hypothetical protein